MSVYACHFAGYDIESDYGACRLMTLAAIYCEIGELTTLDNLSVDWREWCKQFICFDMQNTQPP